MMTNNIQLCEHVCGCKVKLLTESSKQRKKCSGCLLGNCVTGKLPEKFMFMSDVGSDD